MGFHKPVFPCQADMFEPKLSFRYCVSDFDFLIWQLINLLLFPTYKTLTDIRVSIRKRLHNSNVVFSLYL